MPGLSQLKQFDSDILSLGNEPGLRAARGEKPVTVPIPKNIKDIDDSDDFIMGMPEVSEEQIKSSEEAKPEDDDFSEITGFSAPEKSASTNNEVSNSAIDLSNLVGNLDLGGTSSDDLDEQLSAFEEPVKETKVEEEPEQEEKEPEIADLSLDDLLSGAGFDGSEGAQDNDSIQDSDSLENSDENEKKSANPIEELDSVAEEPKKESKDSDDSEFSDPAAQELLNGLGLNDSLENNNSDSKDNSFNVDKNSFDESIFNDSSSNSYDELSPSLNDESSVSNDNSIGTENAEDSTDFSSSDKDEPSFDLDNLNLDDLNLDEQPEEPESAKNNESSSDFDLDSSKKDASLNDDFDFSGDVIDMDDDLPPNVSEESAPKDDNKDFGLSEQEIKGSEPSDFESSVGNPDGLFDASDLDEIPEFSEPADSSDFDSVKKQPSSDDSNSLKSDDDFLSGFDFNMDDSVGDEENGSAFEENASQEPVDISQMEGLDFPETDSKIGEKSDFDLGSADDFKMDNGDFEIPGFSDVQTVEEGKNGKIKTKKPASSSDKSANLGELPPNSLSDEQYQKFLKNLSNYPLNVRIAVEDLIVKNEFTDEAEFEIIKKVLKKVSARQLASELEKMLDISLPVPRDFERRTADEYEKYKQSFQYQLKNKIIPGILFGLLAVIILILLSFFVKNFIYEPLKASSLYKQGYDYLKDGEYPLSDEKFIEATKHRMKKNWFFKYARGYRERNQYIRAEKMYFNILKCFNQDKQAGLEYAQMELSDLANYEKAEEVLLREVLEHHINDSDGILLLGDTYLDWASEKDSSKFEKARVEYAKLIQLYGQTDLNMSRMMRYFIRTDNLLEVLSLKGRFMPKEKSLSGQDWTELGGFLLDKLYGPLPPSDEFLRAEIGDVKKCLLNAVKLDKDNPIALYNLSRYFVQTKNSENAKATLAATINTFASAKKMKYNDVYKYIDSYRLLGEEYTKEKEYLKSMEVFTDGISLYLSEHNGAGLKGNKQVGKLYSDIADIYYFISGDLDNALQYYKDSIENDNDNGKIRYKIGYIQYNKKNFSEALGSFMKASDDSPDDSNLLLAMGNVLSLNNDNYAAQGYYERLLDALDSEKDKKGILFPQVHSDDAQTVDSYLKTSNNLGVTLYRLATRTGRSDLNAQAMVQFQNSMRAWDALTRNQTTLVRMEGGNLAEQNMKYATQPYPEFQPAIYTDIARTLASEKGLKE